MDVTGRTVVQEAHFTGTATVPVDAISEGAYLCRIIGQHGNTWVGRLVIGR